MNRRHEEGLEIALAAIAPTQKLVYLLQDLNLDL